MKIFYAVQATGNGHISRATQLYPYLQKFGTVDFFLSGNNASLHTNLPVKYKSDGCSLHYSKCGGLQYWDIIKNVRPTQIYKDAQSLPLKNYDVIINCPNRVCLSSTTVPRVLNALYSLLQKAYEEIACDLMLQH